MSGPAQDGTGKTSEDRAASTPEDRSAASRRRTPTASSHLTRRRALGWGIGAVVAAVVVWLGVLVHRWFQREVVGVGPRKIASREDMTIFSGLRYAQQAGQGGVMDVYVPRGEGPFPVLMWTFGSGWTSDRGNEGGERIAEAMVPHGYAVAAFSVRSSGQGSFPSHVHDAKAAVRWLRDFAGDLKLDRERIAMGGNSSGGWIAMMAGVTAGLPRFEGQVGDVWDRPSDVQAVVNFFAPVDFLTMDGQMLPGACESFNEGLGITECHSDAEGFESRMLGVPVQESPQLVHEASPRTYIGRRTPPTLIVHGTRDTVVPHQQSRDLYEDLVRADVPSIYYEVHGAGHVVDLTRDTAVTTSTVHHHRVPLAGRRRHFSWDAVAAFLDDTMPATGPGEGGPERARPSSGSR